MRVMQEFKTFALRGNVVDLAVGVVIGAAFGKIVGSLVDHVIMPPIGLLIGGVDFADIGITLREESGEAAAVVMQVGTFINTLIQFIIIAFAIFLVVKAINRMQRKEDAKPAPPPEPSAEEKLLAEIRDLLKTR
jgi:large conductance mechanosensitive channel